MLGNDPQVDQTSDELAALRRRVETLEACERYRRAADSGLFADSIFAPQRPELPPESKEDQIQITGPSEITLTGTGGSSSDEISDRFVTNPRTGEAHDLGSLESPYRERAAWSIKHGGDMRIAGSVLYTRDPDESERVDCGEPDCQGCVERFRRPKSDDAAAPVDLPRGGFF